MSRGLGDVYKRQLDATVRNIIRKMAITDALTEENAAQRRNIGKAGLPYQASLFEE